VEISGYRLAWRTPASDTVVLRSALGRDADLLSTVRGLGASDPPLRFFATSEADAVLAALERLAPGYAERVSRDADRLCDRRFRILGTDAVELGWDLPWHEDFLTGYRWSPRRYYKRFEIPFDQADIKVPWELSRLQHLTTLGIAYRATGTPRYAEEVVRQIDDWIASNRPGLGINWGTAMEVAIRAVNWLWAYHLVHDAPAMSDEFRTRLLASLLAHARHIARNLEGHPGGVTTNHTVANYAGLVYLGAALRDFPEARGWLDTGLRGSAECVAYQVAPDGVHFESSISYHRLVLEMFLGVQIVAERCGEPLPAEYRASLERMLEFTQHYTRPDGLAPLVGDNDDGRLQILSRYFDWSPQDHRHVLAVGASLFDREDFAAAARTSAQAIEEVAWTLGPAAAEAVAGAPTQSEPPSRAFAESGRYVMRHGDDHAFVCADEVGTAGLGSHKHNDIFSYELSVDGAAVVVDRGTYAYMGDVASRERFRSTRSHSTVVVDGTEQNETTELFRMRRDARVEVASWVSKPEHDLLEASHTGYERLAVPAVHRRTILFTKKRFSWVVLDTLLGHGDHSIESLVQLAPDCRVEHVDRPPGPVAANVAWALDELRQAHPAPPSVEIGPGATTLVELRGTRLAIMPLGYDTVAIEAGSFSPRYGQRVPAPTLSLSGSVVTGRTTGYAIVRWS
jgi:uncharacterized heparinase superfamily protein